MFVPGRVIAMADAIKVDKHVFDAVLRRLLQTPPVAMQKRDRIVGQRVRRKRAKRN
jgi:hypothetical protein